MHVKKLKSREPVIILLCGLGCDSRMWEATINEVSADFTFIIPETWLCDSIEEAAGSVVQLLEASEFEGAGLAGLAMGGYVGFEVLKSQKTEKIKAAAFLDTTVLPDPPEKKLTREQTVRLIESGKYEQVLDAFIGSVLSPGNAGPGPLRDLMTEMGRDLGPRRFASCMRAIKERPEFGRVLEDTKIPLLFMAGEEDAMTPPDLARQMSERAPNGSFAPIPSAGHMSPLENPKKTAELLENFFGGKL